MSPMTLKSAASSAQILRVAPRSARRAVLTTRCTAPEASTASAAAPAATSESTIMYGGVSYTETEWSDAILQGKVGRKTAFAAAGTTRGAAPPTLNEVLGFAGSAPEIVNGRLAMLGVTSALAAEAATGQSALAQLASQPTLVSLAFFLVIVGSLVPRFKSKVNEQSIGPFTPAAEQLNGRVAMMGYASLLIIEVVQGTAFLPGPGTGL